MSGQAIGAQAIGAAGLRREITELAGPRAAAVRADAAAVLPGEARTVRATRP